MGGKAQAACDWQCTTADNRSWLPAPDCSAAFIVCDVVAPMSAGYSRSWIAWKLSPAASRTQTANLVQFQRADSLDRNAGRARKNIADPCKPPRSLHLGRSGRRSALTQINGSARMIVVNPQLQHMIDDF